MAWGLSVFHAPGASPEAVRLVLPSGASVDGIARRLHEAGIVERPSIFSLGARLMGRGRSLKAGEYDFAAAISPRQVLDLLTDGRTVVRRITVAEGLTTAQTLALVGAAEGLQGTLPEGQCLVFDDDHYYMGGVIAEKLARAGRDVTLVTTAFLASAWTDNTSERERIQARLLEVGVRIEPNTVLIERVGAKAVLARVRSGHEYAQEMDAEARDVPFRRESPIR